MVFLDSPVIRPTPPILNMASSAGSGSGSALVGGIVRHRSPHPRLPHLAAVGITRPPLPESRSDLRGRGDGFRWGLARLVSPCVTKKTRSADQSHVSA
jgi:hypothetical protein